MEPNIRSLNYSIFLTISCNKKGKKKWLNTKIWTYNSQKINVCLYLSKLIKTSMTGVWVACTTRQWPDDKVNNDKIISKLHGPTEFTSYYPYNPINLNSTMLNHLAHNIIRVSPLIDHPNMTQWVHAPFTLSITYFRP